MHEQLRTFDRHKMAHLEWIHPKPPRYWRPDWLDSVELQERESVENRLAAIERDLAMIKASFMWLYAVLTHEKPPPPAF